MKCYPFWVPVLGRLVIFLSFLLGIKNQLNAENQQLVIDSVENFTFSTVQYQWAFDADSSRGVHGTFLLIKDTLDGNDGIQSVYGHEGSWSFLTTQSSTQPPVLLELPLMDTRGWGPTSFSFHVAAPFGTFEHDDFVGVFISLDGGAHYYPQLKIRGSKSGMSYDGWDFGDGISYSKPFRYAVNSSTLYGHVNPITKDTVTGIGALTITEIPEAAQLSIRVVLQTSTSNGEAYAIDNMSLRGNLVPQPTTLQHWNGTQVPLFTVGDTIQPPPIIQGAMIRMNDTDTLYWTGVTKAIGAIHLQRGYLHAPNLVLDLDSGAAIVGKGSLFPATVRRVLNDTGYYFIGQPAFYPALDTLQYCWVFDSRIGNWSGPSTVYSTPDSGKSFGRVIYLTPMQVPMVLEGTLDSTKVPLSLYWADSVLDGETPMGGWNLVSNTLGSSLDWERMMLSSNVPDSMDATVYRWEFDQGDYGSFNLNSGGMGSSKTIASDEAFWVRLSNEQQINGPVSWDLSAILPAKSASQWAYKTGGNPDTVWFTFTTAGKSGASYQSLLLIDSTYQKNFMPCCDQFYLGNSLQPHLEIRKGTVGLTAAHFPPSSFYPLMITGEGKLMAHGSPGYFYLPPNLTPGSQSLELKGKGPHKVYWLAQDHPDAEVEGEFIGEPIGIPEEARDTVIWPQTNWDLLGRPSTNESPVEIRFENGKWIKVIRLP